MKDLGISKGSIISFDTSSRLHKGQENAIYGWRKHFWNYLNKLNVPFYDACCTDAPNTLFPVQFNATTGSPEYFNGTAWVEFGSGGGAAATGLTAFATGGQASATALTPGFNEVTTVATAGDSVKLPAAVVSTTVTVKNQGVASMDVFPATGDTIDDGSANAAISVPSGATVTFVAIDATNWETNMEVLSTDSILERTAAAGVTVDGVLLKDGGVSTGSLAMIAAFYPQVAQNNITAGTGGAIVVTNYLTTINTDAGGDAFTLANGTQIGQMKKILLVADGGGDGVVTPATAFAGGATTATFNDAADYLILQWNGSAWRVQENSGVTVA